MPESPFFRSSPIRSAPTSVERQKKAPQHPAEPASKSNGSAAQVHLAATRLGATTPDKTASTSSRAASVAPESFVTAPEKSVVSASQSIEALRRKALLGASHAPAVDTTPTGRTGCTKSTLKSAPSQTPVRRATPAELVRRHEMARSRAQLIERLTNPLLTLQETSLLLNVCPATVRRWANAGHIPHVRTEGNQRRFRWHDVQSLMPEHAARRRG